MAAALLILHGGSLVVANDAVILKTGETVKGRIVSESEQQVVIETSNAARTIVTKKTIARSDIAALEKESSEAKEIEEERVALSKHRLNPDKELPLPYVDAVIGSMEKFVFDHPTHPDALRIKRQVAEWKDDRKMTELGNAKFENAWYPGEMKAHIEELRSVKQRREQLERKLSALTVQRTRLRENTTAAHASATMAQSRMEDASDRLSSASRNIHLHQIGYFGDGVSAEGSKHEQVRAKSDRQQAATEASFYGAQVSEGAAEQARVDQEVAEVQRQLASVTSQYEELRRAVRLAPEADAGVRRPTRDDLP